MKQSAIILAAGIGTRMRPLTNHCPKPLIQIVHKPIIAWIIDMLLADNIDNIVVNVHYLGDMLETYLKKHYNNNIIISDERNLLLDSGGGIYKALDYIENESLFVINADCIWLNDNLSALQQMQSIWSPHDMDILKLLCSLNQAIGFDGKGNYNLDAQGHILKSSNPYYAFSGIQLLKKSLFTNLPYKEDEPFSIHHIWEQCFANNTIYGVEFEGQWLHIGTPEGVTLAENMIKEKQFIHKIRA
jgi:MurNAc alpha-1-phosphate uridylyltransferase